jgi:hypothetical protein
LNFGILGQLFYNSRSLEGQFSGGNQNQRLDMGRVFVDAVQDGDQEGSGLASSILGAGDDAILADELGLSLEAV